MKPSAIDRHDGPLVLVTDADAGQVERRHRAERIAALEPERTQYRDGLLEHLSRRACSELDQEDARIARRRADSDITPLEALRTILTKANRPSRLARLGAWLQRRGRGTR